MTSGRLAYFIQSPLYAGASKVSNDSVWPCLGVLALATQVKLKTNWKVKVFDGDITGMKNLQTAIETERPDVVALSVLTNSYMPSLELSKTAKSVNAVTLFGNDHAALWADRIMTKQSSLVDFISTSEFGELSIPQFCNFLDGNISAEDVPGLIYRNKQGDIKKSAAPENRVKGKDGMDQLGIPDRTLLSSEDWASYRENYEEAYGHLHDNVITGVSTMNRARGCARKNARCIYCGIADLTLRQSSPKMFWEDVRAAKRDVNANVMHEVFDSLSSAPGWLRMVVNCKPKDCEDVDFFVYSQAKDITPKSVNLLKRLGCVVINIGMDSGDTRMLKILKGNKDSLDQNMRAACLLRDAGMKIYASFVLGAPSETHESLANTVKFAKWLVDNDCAAGIEAQPLVPMVNSQIGQFLANPKTALRYEGLTINNLEKFYDLHYRWIEEDYIYSPELTKAYHDVCSTVTYDEMITSSYEMASYAQQRNISTGHVGMTQEMSG